MLASRSITNRPKQAVIKLLQPNTFLRRLIIPKDDGISFIRSIATISSVHDTASSDSCDKQEERPSLSYSNENTIQSSRVYYRNEMFHHRPSIRWRVNHRSYPTNSSSVMYNNDVKMIRAFSTKSSNSTTIDDKQQPSTITAKPPPKPEPTIPTPSASFSTTTTPSTTPTLTHYTQKAKDAIRSLLTSLASALAKTPGILWFYLTHPSEFKAKLLELKEHAKKEAEHYWMGTKLLAADIRTARRMLFRTLQGSALTRRERKQLLRTTADLFRLVPMSIFVIIPFMEFALPFALKIFPNMLPSTFQDSLKHEENMKRELQTRIAMAQFFQETLGSLAEEQKRSAAKRKQKLLEQEIPGKEEEEKEETAASFLSFLEKARAGEPIPPDVIIKYATYFRDDFTLDNMPRMQLINMCKYMKVAPYGADSLLRFQLRHKVRILKEDDQRILWEGIDSLTKQELREACRERGMRSTGLSKRAYKTALQQWLDLSVNKHVPISLLIMSRIFFLEDQSMEKPDMLLDKKKPTKQEEDSRVVTSIADAISGLEKGVVNEVVLEVASSNYDKPEYMKIKLEVLNTQNEMIKEEYEAREYSKESREKEKEEKGKEKEEVLVKVSPVDETVEKEPFVAPIVHPEQQAKEITDWVQKDEELQQKMEVETTKEIPKPIEEIAPKDEAAQPPEKEEQIKKEEEEEEEELELSTEEMEAISQLLSPDAVLSEREELERIKAALLSNDEELIEEAVAAVGKKTMDKQGVVKEEEVVQEELPPVEEITTTPAAGTEPKPDIAESEDEKAAETISSMDKEAAETADRSTQITYDTEPPPQEEGSGDAKLDKSVARLKSRVEAMVGKIEQQLSDVEMKIGDKLHLLDKDGDGILTRDELIGCLQQVLKRKLTLDEIMAIVEDMDSDEDGIVTTTELRKWIDTNRLVKLAEEGRDAELESAINKQVEKRMEKIVVEETEQGSSSKKKDNEQMETIMDRKVEEKKDAL